MLGEAMKCSNSLTDLNLSGDKFYELKQRGKQFSTRTLKTKTVNHIGDKGCILINEALKNNSSLTRLDLNGPFKRRKETKLRSSFF